MTPPTSEERISGRLEADVLNMKEQMTAMHGDMEGLKSDVSDIKVMIAELRTELRVLTKRQSPGEVVYAFLLFGAAGIGLWHKDLAPWHAGLMALVGAILLQRGQLDKIVTRYIAGRKHAPETP